MSTDPQKPDTSAFYDYPTEPVPMEKRRGWLNLAFVTAGIAVAMSTLYTGAALGNLLTFKDAVWAIIGASAFLFVMAGIVGGLGSACGVTFSVLARHSFGRSGSMIVGLIWAITLSGWYAYQCGFFGQTINLMFPDHALTQAEVATVWGGLIMMLTAIVGFKAMAILSTIAGPVILGVCFWGVISAINTQGLDAIAAITPDNPATVGTGVTIVIGGWIIGAIMQPDVSRYAISGKHNWIACFLALTVYGLATFAGMVMVKAAQTDTVMEAMTTLGMGAGTLLMVVLAQWTSNDNNLYSASLGAANIIKVEKYKIALVLGLIATCIAFFGVTDFFVPFLVFLGVFVPPIGGIILVDYYFLGRQHQYTFDKSTRYRQWNMAALGASALAAIIANNIDWGVGAINSFVIGGVLYFALMKLSASMRVNPFIGSEVSHESN
ncbi:cytosine permease [Rhodobacteraceae bacterium RKSG542]|uniref:cytosine permease n=1 Tax=Pseudovibrio flavus TaxID=2529854 RepID=UPI0012BCC665|nr:cytosine permease [Pseudovibrio flavus]MTI17981.1 cytosine permease [Pseudovibrio flavus]